MGKMMKMNASYQKDPWNQTLRLNVGVSISSFSLSFRRYYPLRSSKGRSSLSQRALIACLKYKVVIPKNERRQMTTRTKFDEQS